MDGDRTRLIVDTCLVTGNVVSGDWAYGGGICSGSAGPRPWVIRSTIAGNRGEYGGGLCGIPTGGMGYWQVYESIVWGNCAESGREIWTHVYIEADGVDVDTSGGGVEGIVALVWSVYEDPLFCGPVSCADAPAIEGDYTLDAASPCLPENNPWGWWAIGALGQGCDISTGVTSAWEAERASRFLLFPNPTRGEVTLRSGMHRVSPSVVDVFDVSGRLVRLLDLPLGVEHVVWDGKDEAGRDVRPGTYFFRFDDNMQSEVKRVTVVR